MKRLNGVTLWSVLSRTRGKPKEFIDFASYEINPELIRPPSKQSLTLVLT